MLKKTLAALFIIVFFCAVTAAQENPYKQGDNTKAVNTEVKSWNTACPVDGKTVNPEVETIEFNDKNYGFCSSEDAEKFKSDPKLYSKNLNEDGTKFIGKQENKTE